MSSKTLIFLISIFVFIPTGAQSSDYGKLSIGSSASFARFGNGGMGLSQRNMSILSVDSVLGPSIGEGNTFGVAGNYFFQQQHTALHKVNGTNLAGTGYLAGLGFQSQISEVYLLQTSLFFLGRYSFKYQTSNTRESHLDRPIGLQIKLQRLLTMGSSWTADVVLGWNRWKNYHTNSTEYQKPSKMFSVGIGISKIFHWKKSNDPALNASAPREAVSMQAASERKKTTAPEVSIYYAPRKWKLEEGNQVLLRELVQRLSPKNLHRILIVGHTDSVGTKERNEFVAGQRVDQVRDFLIKLGIPEGKIETKNQSNLEPASSNESPEGRSKNRRVDVRIVEE